MLPLIQATSPWTIASRKTGRERGRLHARRGGRARGGGQSSLTGNADPSPQPAFRVNPDAIQHPQVLAGAEHALLRLGA